jgi:cell division protein FtsA
MTKTRFYVTLEIGTARIRILVGERPTGSGFMITGVADCDSRGMRKSEIIDLDTVESCLREALKQVEQNSDYEVHEVLLLVTGGDLNSRRNQAVVQVINDRNELGADIAEEDRTEALENARRIALAGDREMLHCLPRHFMVDNKEGITNPVGLFAYQLTAEALTVHVRKNTVQNLRNLLERIPLNVSELAASGYAAAEAVLAPEQKKAGVAVIDLGAGTTKICAYHAGAATLMENIAVGGDHITQDISFGLHLPTAQAEQLKKTAGNALRDVLQQQKTIPVPASVGFAGQMVKTAALHSIINCRMEELFEIIRGRLEEEKLLAGLAGGVILTGGGACLNGVRELAQRVFACPAAIGKVQNMIGLPGTGKSVQFASAAGGLLLAEQMENTTNGAGRFNPLKFLRKRK